MRMIRTKIYMAVEGPRNSNGDDPTLPTNNMNGWTLTLISKIVNILTRHSVYGLYDE